ncbi:MAG: hypothetical protein J6J43_07130 [Oscillospiraceae bacterium]|nr:hypothetical protein [Oscillospiraceae bacterium]
MRTLSEVDPNLRIPGFVAGEDVCFYDVRQEPFRVYGVFYEKDRFRRMPEEVALSVSKNVHYLHSNTTGGRVRFVTDSPYVAVHMETDHVDRMPHFSMTGMSGLDLYADGRYCGTFVPPTDLEDGFENILDLPSAQLREMTIHMPLYTDVKTLKIGLKEGSQLLPPSPYAYDKPVVFYGHSITQGACASRPGNSYPNMLSRRLQIDHINLGFSGSAKAEPQMAEYIASLPMLAFVMDYDGNSPTREHLQSTHEPFFKIIREKNPELPVIFMTATNQARFFRDKELECRKDVIRRTYENALAAGDQHVYYLDGSKIYEGFDDATVEGCHANDLGFWLQANAVGALLQQIL